MEIDLQKRIEEAAHSSNELLLEERERFKMSTDKNQKEFTANNTDMAAALDEAKTVVSKLQNDLEKEHTEIKLLKSNIEVLSTSAQGGAIEHKKQIEDLMSKQKLEFEE